MDIEPVNTDSEPEDASSEYTNIDFMPNDTVGTESHCSDEYPNNSRLTIIQSGVGGNDEIEREHINVRSDSESVNIDCKVVKANMEHVVKELTVVDEESHSNEPTNNTEEILGTHIYQLMKDFEKFDYVGTLRILINLNDKKLAQSLHINLKVAHNFFSVVAWRAKMLMIGRQMVILGNT